MFPVQVYAVCLCAVSVNALLNCLSGDNLLAFLCPFITHTELNLCTIPKCPLVVKNELLIIILA